MGVEIRAPNNRIPLLIYPSRELLCRTHLRPQEFYESPEFKGKVGFTLDEFMRWYPQSQGKTEFTYYTDWSGFNTPSECFAPFFDGKFNPLSQEENALVSFLKTVPQPFYMIATFKTHLRACGVVRHELGHALWRTNADYQIAARQIVERYNPQKLFNHLIEKGYDHSVMADEAHAQAIHCRQSAREFMPEKMINQMRALFLKSFPAEHLEIYTRGLQDEKE